MSTRTIEQIRGTYNGMFGAGDVSVMLIFKSVMSTGMWNTVGVNASSIHSENRVFSALSGNLCRRDIPRRMNSCMVVMNKASFCDQPETRPNGAHRSPKTVSSVIEQNKRNLNEDGNDSDEMCGRSTLYLQHPLTSRCALVEPLSGKSESVVTLSLFVLYRLQLRDAREGSVIFCFTLPLHSCSNLWRVRLITEPHLTRFASPGEFADLGPKSA